MPIAPNKMVRNGVWWLYNVCVWFVPVPSYNIFCSSVGLDMSDFALWWNFSTYMWTILIASVFIHAILCALHVISLLGSVSYPSCFIPGNSTISVSLSSCLAVPTGTILSTSLPCNVLVSTSANMTMMAGRILKIVLIKMRWPCILIQSSGRGVCRQACALLGKIAAYVGQFCRGFLLAGLGSRKFSLCFLAEDVQLAKEPVSKGSWIWLLRHIIQDSAGWI